MKRLQLTPYASARIEDNCPQETIDALTRLVEAAYNMELPRKNKTKIKNHDSINFKSRRS